MPSIAQSPNVEIGSNKKDDGPNPSSTGGGGGRQRGASMARPSNGGWLPPGTRQEHTWRMGDQRGHGQGGAEQGPQGVAVMS